MKQLKNKYKYQFSKMLNVLSIVGVLVAITCIIFNVINYLNFLNANIAPGLYDYLSIFLSIGLSLFFIVFIIFAIFNSYYEITNTSIIVHYGILKSKYDCSEIKEIKLLSRFKKLTLVFKDETFFFLSMSPIYHEQFIDELKKKFPSIVFVQVSEEK